MANNFESEITCFLKDLKKAHPDMEKKQIDGRARLWDREIDFELQEGYQNARVPQKAYVYQTN
ncbi:MAG: DUF3460 family protein [Corticimicrobacter sp.]|uniref:DUF3460 domain-containing protein n=1 Tax=Corticimicrobacter populi TaxID=2175229 RepID=A0A2V1JXS6_9BURK|nr:DUF3460 family protein [Corticimicrobacter populi]PWF21038.1 DUF3460 domain-containing protein [Corticimicrobacter populi]QDQ88411.1 DUF3460 family protein [Alcaligenaceae bacterium SJ-26]